MTNSAHPIEILLVEDSPTDRLICVEALQHAKVLNSPNVVENGVEAMAYLRREGKYSSANRPELILLDLNLPKKDGREVLQEIKRDPVLKFIPVVVLTTSKAEDDIIRAYGDHANSYITKPIDFVRFSEVIRSIVNYWFEVVTLPPSAAVQRVASGETTATLRRRFDINRVVEVLLAEDNPADVIIIREALRDSARVRFNITHVERLSDIRDQLRTGVFDIVLTDLGLPDSQGLDTYRQLRSMAGGLPIIVLTGLDDEAIGIAALHEGAQEYLVKGEVMERSLARALRYAMEKMSVEAQLRQAQKMEAIGQLSAGVAHDFNNILAAMLMEAELAATVGNTPAEVREAMSEIKGYVERAANLTRQLLTFSRQQVMMAKSLDLNEVVGGIAKMFSRILGEDVRIELQLGIGVPRVEADVGMMEQVVLNLAVNARDAMPNGGKLTIQTGMVQVSPEDTNRHADAYAGSFVSLAVKDTGTGMSQEVMARIFEPFFTTKDVGKGTGLGLATVHTIVQQHRGWIEVQSQVGDGTTFEVFLPASTVIHAPPPLAASNDRRGTETILIVEDEVAVRSLIKVTLERQGYHVIEAGSGAAATALWEEHRAIIALLFTDMVMPDGISGRQLAERLQASSPALKVIFSSGYSQDFQSEDFNLEDGVNFLAKPYPLNKLLGIVRTCLDRK